MQKLIVFIGFVLLGVLIGGIAKKIKVSHLATAEYREHWILAASPEPKVMRSDAQRNSNIHSTVEVSVVSSPHRSVGPFQWPAVHPNSGLD